MIPPSSIAEIKTTNNVHTRRTHAAGTQTTNKQDRSPPDSASDGMEQDPIPGWDEMARTPKEREYTKITNDQIQQAGRADPEPPTEEDSEGETPGRHQAREDTVQEEGGHSPSKHLHPSREKSEGDDKLVTNDLRK